MAGNSESRAGDQSKEKTMAAPDLFCPSPGDEESGVPVSPPAKENPPIIPPAPPQITFFADEPVGYEHKFITIHSDLLMDAIKDSKSDDTRAARKLIRVFLEPTIQQFSS